MGFAKSPLRPLPGTWRLPANTPRPSGSGRSDIGNGAERLTRDGRKLALYGAGHLSAAFVNFHELGEYFAFVVDDTPQKQGLYLPGCGLPIVAQDRLNSNQIAACLMGFAPQIEDKVIANNAGFQESRRLVLFHFCR